MLALWVSAGFQADAGITTGSWFQPLNYALSLASPVSLLLLLRRSRTTAPS